MKAQKSIGEELRRECCGQEDFTGPEVSETHECDLAVRGSGVQIWSILGTSIVQKESEVG
jgi:hypothetical protein